MAQDLDLGVRIQMEIEDVGVAEMTRGACTVLRTPQRVQCL